MTRRYQWGAEPAASGHWSFALWSPEAQQVSARVEGRDIPLSKDPEGWHRGEGPASAGETYMLVVDGTAIPDPASRAQSGGVHDPSILIAPHHDFAPWTGRPWEEAVIFELHVGLFTPEGTFFSAIHRLPALAEMGITMIEVMPVGQFAGNRGWGYDGVLPWAPHPAYGPPEAFRAFVDAAHALGLSVILDTVHNHFGPDGAWLGHVTPSFFHPEIKTPWGPAIAFDQAPVRAFFIESALHWLREYNLDGFRFDAVDQIRETEDSDFLVELATTLRGAGFERPIHLTTEDNRNITRLHDPAAGLYDGEWNDDYHHCIHVMLTGESHSYYASFGMAPFEDLMLSLKCGYVEQGQPRPPQKSFRGESSLGLPWPVFVNFNQNHDQIGNRAKGERLLALADPDAVRIAHALLLLGPFVPMLFMGEEAGETAPFQFFVDFEGDLAEAVRKGRYAEFPGVTEFPDPTSPETYERSRPYAPEAADAEMWRDQTYRLLSFRHDYIVPLMKSGGVGTPDVQRLGTQALMAEWTFGGGRLRIAVDFASNADIPAGGDMRLEYGAHRIACWIDT
ncbi:malto-oligosyltrehalose trehalohydrolase [Falsirhodobacter sp. alg1]|uniref:malto-oligosyltrehalose trehalohydrolase n=1 Tax=Falsirhodobacter sp. alg1 TaxID=1472418 RepID=UPI000787885F|nr:malto-oligosyltrehalose trehalohydrolase [Falsirhodobacter sp. alg1]